jgi:hypothetical protein
MTPAVPVTKVEIKMAADHREVYVNWCQIKTTVMDFLLKLGVARDGAQSGHLLVTNILDVALSPQEAKTLVATLGMMVAAYEKQHGTIPAEVTQGGTVQ